MTTELQRIKDGPSWGEKPGGVIARFTATADGDAAAVLERCRAVMVAVVNQAGGQWPSDEQWRSILPSWFVARCAAEITQAEAERRRSLPFEERKKLADEWSVGAWTHWFRPSERSWHWWDARVIDQGHLAIDVLVENVPFAMGAIKWLLRAAGASHVSEPQT